MPTQILYQSIQWWTFHNQYHHQYADHTRGHTTRFTTNQNTHCTCINSQSPQFTTCWLITANAKVSAGNIKTSAKHFIGWRSTMLVRNNTVGLRIPTTSKQVACSSFGAKLQSYDSYQKLRVTFIQLKTNIGEVLPINVVIVPSIAAPIQNLFCVSIDSVTCLWTYT